MRAVVQRVGPTFLTVDGREISRIAEGLVCYLGVQQGDSDHDLSWTIKKVSGLRVFSDAQGKMNLSVLDLGLEILVVSQFTLFGDVRKGFRPSFTESEAPEPARLMYERFMEGLRQAGVRRVCGGVFAADMHITQENRGPVTILLDSRLKTAS